VANSPVSTDGASQQAKVSPLLEISNAMVRLYKEAYGRGPTKARAQFAGPDTLLVTFENCMTATERSLIVLGEHGRVRDTRLLIRHGLEDQFRAIVERALQRRTLAFVSGVDTRYDICVELFTLEPSGGADVMSQDGAADSVVWPGFEATGQG
jgi:uncharacterized protein YbcI